MFFLSTRALPVGGGIGPLSILDESNAIHSVAELTAAVRGRDVLLVTHGFNVNQSEGLQKLSNWPKLLKIGSTVPVGMLWPGDARWIHAIDYPIEGNEAMAAANQIATFLKANFSGALSLSFASHSLGARVVLQIIAGLGRPVRRLLLMAGAIDNTCLSAEYAGAAAGVQSISVLASRSDDVLKWAFPAGNFASGLFSRAAPYIHEALGREGPAAPYPAAQNLHADWQIPDGWDYGHGSYLPPSPLGANPVPFDPLPGFPAPDMRPPPDFAAPAALADDAELWQPGFSAAIQTSRWP